MVLFGLLSSNFSNLINNAKNMDVLLIATLNLISVIGSAISLCIIIGGLVRLLFKYVLHVNLKENQKKIISFWTGVVFFIPFGDINIIANPRNILDPTDNFFNQLQFFLNKYPLWVIANVSLVLIFLSFVYFMNLAFCGKLNKQKLYRMLFVLSILSFTLLCGFLEFHTVRIEDYPSLYRIIDAEILAVLGITAYHIISIGKALDDKRMNEIQTRLGGKDLKKISRILIICFLIGNVILYDCFGHFVEVMFITLVISVIISLTYSNKMQKILVFFEIKMRSLIHVTQVKPTAAEQNNGLILNQEFNFKLGTDLHEDDVNINDSGNSNKTNSNVIYEQGVIIVDQLPFLMEDPEKFMPLLLSLLGDKFGFSFTLSNSFKWEIFFPALKGTGYHIAITKLNNLMSNYKGFYGKAGVRVFTKKNLVYNRSFPYYELKSSSNVFPDPLRLFQFIASASNNISANGNVSITFIFNKTKQHHKYGILKSLRKLENNYGQGLGDDAYNLWRGRLYEMGIFFRSTIEGKKLQDIKNTTSNLNGLSESLATQFNTYGKPQATFKPCNKDVLINIAKVKLLHYILITPFLCDFNFNAEFDKIERVIPIPGEIFKAVNIPKRIDSLLEFKKTYYPIGNRCKNGIPTETTAFLKFDHSVYNILVAGLMGTGKTTLLANIINNFAKFRLGCGTLIINKTKKNEHIKYKNFHYLKWGDPALKIPYFITESYSKTDIMDAINRCSKIFAASFGILDFTEKYFSIPLQKFYAYYLSKPDEAMTPVPIKYKTALKMMIAHVLDPKNAYASKSQKNIEQLILQRTKLFTADKTYMNTLDFLEEIPEWFERFLSGENFYIDLFGVNTDIAKNIFMFLMQMLDVFTRNRNNSEMDHVENLISINEAHWLLHIPEGVDSHEDRYVRQQQLLDFFRPFLTEYRSRKFGFIICDQQPSRLMEGLPDLISTKLLFKLGITCALKCSANEEMAQYIEGLRNYNCVVIERGERLQRYRIQTFNSEIKSEFDA